MPPKTAKKKSVEPIEPQTPVEVKEVDFEEESETQSKELPEVKMVNIGKLQLEENKDKKKKQLRHSNYFITINPNIRSVEGSQQMEDQIKKLTYAMDHMQENLKEWLIIKEPKVELNKDTIKTVNFDYSVEWKDCVHAHAQVLISHYTRVQINPTWMQKYIKTQLGIPLTKKIHFDYKLLRDNKTTLEAYLRKQYKPGGVLAKN